MSDEHTYTIYVCPECGKQAGHFSATTCQHFDPAERYVEMEEVEVAVKKDWGIRGAPIPSDPTEVVSLLVPESVARAFERTMLKPFGQSLAPPVTFSEDDVPTYIISIA
jgi:hypothetical protein